MIGRKIIGKTTTTSSKTVDLVAQKNDSKNGTQVRDDFGVILSPKSSPPRSFLLYSHQQG
jgi:hypothetical protein